MILTGARAIAAHVGRSERTLRRWIREDPLCPVQRFRRQLLADSRKLDVYVRLYTRPAWEREEGTDGRL